MEIKLSLIKRLVLALTLVTLVVVPMVGCSKSEDDFDPNKIAKPQPGSGPPPMGQPSAPAKPGTNG